MACATFLSVASFAQGNPPLNFGDNFFVTGDYVVAGAYGMTTNFSNGYAVGTFVVPDENPGIRGTNFVPLGAEVVAAFVYWQTVENASVAPGQPGSGQNGFFRPLIPNGPPAPGYPMAGVSLPGQNAVSWSSGGCSEPQAGKITRTYRANVLGSFPQDSKGNILADGAFEIRLPSVGPSTPLTLGATLVIVYRVLSPTVPLNSIVIYDGAFGQSDVALNMTQTVQGFYDADHHPVSKLTLIAGAGKSNKYQTVYLDNIALPSHSGHNLPPFPGYYGDWDNPTWTFGNPFYQEVANPVLEDAASATTQVVPSANGAGCLSWGAVIFSTTVKNPDGDGLLSSWKTAGGYCDASINGGVCTHGSNSDPGWVALPGATLGEKDLFIQLDYMCSQTTGVDSCAPRDGTNYSFDPRPSGAAAMMVQAFLNHGVHVHINPTGPKGPSDTIQPVHAIEEQNCSDLPGPPLALCAFPNQAGVVGWKGGYAYFKNQLVETGRGNVLSCLGANPAADCQPRFQHGRKDSWHYALFAHAIGRTEWKLQGGTLTSVVQSGNTVTFTTSTPLGTLTHGGYDNHGNILPDPTCLNGRVSIYYAATNPNLNGTFCINTSAAPFGDTFTIVVPGPSENAHYTLSTDPYLSVAPGQTGSASGVSDVGGADSLITLGLWGDPTLASSNGQQKNTIAGTFMHETGHSLGLTHGGFYYDLGLSLLGIYTPTIEPNCKPNFQSVMNYFFQVDLLNGALDYSEQQLDPLNEANLPAGITYRGGAPFYPTTKWYTPIPPLGVGSKVSSHCDGTPPLPSDPPATFLVPGAADPISPAWDRPKSDVDFDGIINSQSPYLRGYSDWAPGGTLLGGITTGIDFRQIGATGNVSVVSELNFFGGGINLNGGGINLNGGGINLNGGGQNLNGGGINLNGGGINLNGGGINLNGGGQALNGGGINLNGGGEIDQKTADSYTRPPTGLAASEAASSRSITLTWTAPTFGQIGAYKIYRSSDGGKTFTVLTSVNGNPPAPTYTDTVTCNNPTGYQYFVTAVLSATSTNPGQESVPSNIVMIGQNSGTLTGCYIVTGFSSPASGVQGSPVAVTWTLTDDFNPTANPVTNLAANTLVAIGPLPGNCNTPTSGRTTLLANGAPTYPGDGFNNNGDQFTFTWNGTDAFCAGSYTFELDLDHVPAPSGPPAQVVQTSPGSPLQLAIDVNDTDNAPGPHVAVSALPTGTAGVVYGYTLPEDGGTAPFTWSIIPGSGSLPAGLNFNTSTGTVSGTPTTACTCNFAVQVKDSKGNVGSQALTLKVLIFVSYSTPPTVNPLLPNATAGMPISDTIQQYGAVGAVTWSITNGTLPPGTPSSLTLATGSLGNGVLAGTPSTAGTYTFTAQAMDSQGNMGSLALTIAVNIFVSYNSNPPTANGNLPAATAGIGYVPNPNGLLQYGGVGAVSWSVIPGGTGLPTGISLSPSGVLSGTASTAGNYTFTAQAMDSKGNTGSLAFTIPVNIFVSYSAPPALNGFLPNGTAGIAYAANPILQYGAVGAVTWSYTGSVPPGLALSTALDNSGDGVLSGTPTVADTYIFTAIATDSKGNVGSLAFMTTILIFESDSAAPNITKTLPAGTAGSAYSNTIDESGGTGALTWVITSGNLPPGLSLGSSTGIVSGTPTAPGTYTFTAQVTDSASPPNMASLQFMLNVADAQYGDLIVADGNPAVDPIGTLFRVTPTGTSGTIAAIANGLPTGVAVDSNSGNIYASVAPVNGVGTPGVTQVGPFGAVNSSFAPAGVLTNPIAVAVDRTGNVYVADNNTSNSVNAIYEFNSSGAQVGSGAFATLPSSGGLPNHIRMAFEGSGNLDVVSDEVDGEMPGIEVDQIAANGNITVLYNTATQSTATYALTAAGAADQNGNTTYTGAFSSAIPAGSSVTINGFANSNNDGGPFVVVTCCTNNLLVLNNPNGVADTSGGTAAVQLAQIEHASGLAILSDGSIDVADYNAPSIYNITNPGAANMAITTAIGPISSLCCNISGMANPPASPGAPATLYLTLSGVIGAPQLAQVVPSASTVTTVSSTQTYALTAVSGSSGTITTYTGTFSPTIPAGASVTISGFTNAGNNGQFNVVSCTGTTLTVSNSAGGTETNPGAAVVATPLSYPNDVAWYNYQTQ